MMHLDTSLEQIKGVGTKTAEAFARAGLYTVRDAINFFPYRYEDYSHIQKTLHIKPGKVTLVGKIEHLSTRRVRRGLHITEATIVDDTGKIPAVWFNQPYRADQLRLDTNQQWFISGEYGLQGHKYQLLNPSVEKYSQSTINAARIVPIYRSIAGLKSHIMRRLMFELKPFMSTAEEIIPSELLTSSVKTAHADALLALHFPDDENDISTAQKHIGLEELFCLMLASQLNKDSNTQLVARPIKFDVHHAQQFVARLPFTLTNAQRIVIWQIIKDFQMKHPMNRLLQGDVGSGKTVVAAMTASIAAQAGYQTAVMAPTEILARQHAATVEALVKPFGLRVGLLTSSVKGSARKLLYEAIKSGEIDIIIGTHALIQDTVVFHKLGFVVIDEQHRFGVQQRQKLLQKATYMPHVLLMTATPIPRSLALTLYGELDISILNEKPKNRRPIRTKLVSPNSRNEMYEAVEKELSHGRQAYVVCARIDEDHESEKRSVEAEYKKLRQTVFSHRRIALLHGQLKADEKQKIMERFLDHKIDILIATTVIEVGVDVPNATIMIIENADQFGLAQVHQLRGRVGRGEHQSYCYLVSSTSLKPTRRMRELEKSNDGFYLAEMDLELRGPGEVYGKAQHGELKLEFANIRDTQALSHAQKLATEFIQKKYNLLQYPETKKMVEQYQRMTTLN